MNKFDAVGFFFYMIGNLPPWFILSLSTLVGANIFGVIMFKEYRTAVKYAIIASVGFIFVAFILYGIVRKLHLM